MGVNYTHRSNSFFFSCHSAEERGKRGQLGYLLTPPPIHLTMDRKEGFRACFNRNGEKREVELLKLAAIHNTSLEE